MPDASPLALPADAQAWRALLASVLAETAAAAAWWQQSSDGRVLARIGLAEAADAVCLATIAVAGAAGTASGLDVGLWVAAPSRPAGPAVALAQTVAVALLDAWLRTEALRLEAARHRDAGRVASDWLWESDVEGRIVWLSETLLPLTGEPSSRELGRVMRDIYSPRSDEHAASWQRYLEARAARRPFRNLLVDRELPRGRATVSISGDPRFDAQGRFCGYRGASRDVTAELATRQDAARSRALLEQTLAGLPARVMISSPEDRVLLANAGWQGQMGTASGGVGESWPEQVRRQVAQGSYPQAHGREEEFIAWRLSLTSDDPVPQELRWRDGWVLAIDRRLADGSVVHMSVDITERKRAEEALAAAELRWRFALEGAGEAVWDWNAETDRTYFSQRWREMLGLAADEVGDDWRTWARRVHPDDKRRVLTALQQHIDGHSDIYETVHRVQHASGHYLWLRDRGKAVLRDAQGRALRIVGTHSDITRERQAEAEAAERRALELASRAKSEFLSRMSHEMRTPLNALLGFARLLQQQGVYRDDYLQHMLTAGSHLHQLINDVLDVQQVEQGVLVLQRLPVDLAATVAEVNSLLAPQAEQVDVRLGPAPEAAAWVLADPQRLRQVLLNLGSNAVKYNRAGGHVRWTLAPLWLDGASAWCLQIEDDGLGMDPQQLARLFQPFERLGRENSGIEGTGLGLVIARRLVEALGGRITVHSSMGQGTCVQVQLPATAAPAETASQVPHLPVQTAAQTAAHTAVPAARERRPRRVLLVEDDSLSALLFSEALRQQPGFELQVAGSAAEALAQVSGWLPELLVIDGHLPDAKGHELLQRLRGLPGLDSVPAVMATADAMPTDREAALARGFQAHWPKPLDVRHLPAQLLGMLPP